MRATQEIDTTPVRRASPLRHTIMQSKYRSEYWGYEIVVRPRRYHLHGGIIRWEAYIQDVQDECSCGEYLGSGRTLADAFRVARIRIDAKAEALEAAWTIGRLYEIGDVETH